MDIKKSGLRWTFYLLGYDAVQSTEVKTNVSKEHTASVFMVEG
jgi:hypothetical protein